MLPCGRNRRPRQRARNGSDPVQGKRCIQPFCVAWSVNGPALSPFANVKLIDLGLSWYTTDQHNYRPPRSQLHASVIDSWHYHFQWTYFMALRANFDYYEKLEQSLLVVCRRAPSHFKGMLYRPEQIFRDRRYHTLYSPDGVLRRRLRFFYGLR